MSNVVMVENTEYSMMKNIAYIVEHDIEYRTRHVVATRQRKHCGFSIHSKSKSKLDPVGSTVRYEMMKLCTRSVEDTMRR